MRPTAHTVKLCCGSCGTTVAVYQQEHRRSGIVLKRQPRYAAEPQSFTNAEGDGDWLYSWTCPYARCGRHFDVSDSKMIDRVIEAMNAGQVKIDLR